MVAAELGAGHAPTATYFKPHLFPAISAHPRSKVSTLGTVFTGVCLIFTDFLPLAVSVTIHHTALAVRVPIPGLPSALTPTWGATGTAYWPIGRQLCDR